MTSVLLPQFLYRNEAKKDLSEPEPAEVKFDLLKNRPGWEMPESEHPENPEYGGSDDYEYYGNGNEENPHEPESMEPELETFLTVKHIKLTFSGLSKNSFTIFSVSKLDVLGK